MITYKNKKENIDIKKENVEKEIFIEKIETGSILTENKGITYEILKQKDLEETAYLIAEDFSRAEPMAKSIGITADEFHYFAEIYCKKAVNDGLSIIAKDKGKIIGFIISEDLESDPPEGIEKINTKFEPIMALLNNLDEEYKKSFKIEGDRIFHMFMGGVDEQHEKKHIVTTLSQENLKLAKSKNFSVAIGEATGLATQHILRDKLGFEEKIIIRYKDFVYKGEYVFKKIEDSPGCILMEKRFVNHLN